MRTAALFCAAGILAAAPTLRDLSPRGAQKGRTVQLVLKGSELKPGTRLQSGIPGAVSRLVPRESMRPDTELPFLVEVAKNAPTGLYPVRVVNNDGLSNLLLFSVGEFPEMEEAESADAKRSNGDAKSAETLAIPSVVNGTLGEADIDFYAADVKAGQKLVFETEANVLGSAIDPAIEILDAAGKTIAKNDDAPGNGIDARLEFAFKTAGRYYVRVHDSKYSDQSVNFYRLKVGAYAFAEGIFPLGGRRGQPVSVMAAGGNLAKPAPVIVDTNTKARFQFAAVPGSASLPFLFELSDKTEALEPSGAGPHALAADTVMNGRIAGKGEIDRYRVAVKPGDHWVFEMRASSLGTSQLDGILTLYDAKGAKLASRDDLAGADPVLPFEIPAGVEDVTVAVEDLLGRGGPAFGYRLEARKEPADFLARLTSAFVNVPAGGTAIVTASIQRRGYDGEARLTIPNLPPGFTVAGGHIAPAAAQQRFDDPNPRFSAAATTLTITAGPGVKPLEWGLKVIATADTPQGKIVREAEGPGLVVAVKGLRQKSVTANWLEIGLPMALSRSVPVTLSTPVPLVRISQGVEYPLSYKVVTGMNAKAGKPRETIATQVGNLRILQGPPSKNPATGSLLVNTNFATPTAKFDMLTAVTAEIDGKQVEVYAPMVTFEVVPGYRVWPNGSEWRVAPGGSFRIDGTVHREPTFEGGLVRVEGQELPEGVSCQPAEAAAESRQFSMECRAEAGAAKGTFEIAISSQAPDTGRNAKDTYKIPVVPGKLIIQ